MAEDGQLARIAGRSVSASEPTLADLLDPIALEERLREARARRANALARRSENPAGPPHAEPAPTDPPAFLAASPPAPRRSAAAVPILIFLAGLGLGGAVVAVLALQALPARIAAEPEASFTPAAAVAPAGPPVIATRPPDVAAVPPAAAAGAAPATPPPAEALALRDPSGLAAPASEAPPPRAAPLPPALEAALSPEPPVDPPAPPPAAAGPADEPALPAQVFIHYPSSAAGAAARARDALRSAGVARVDIVSVRYAIGRSNIRFYHDGDRQPATALAPLLAAALDGQPPEARDFTDYATPTAPGKVELWLAGTTGSTASPAPARSAPATPRPPTPRPAAASPAPLPMPAVLAPAPSQAEQVERILIERLTQAR